MSSVDLEVEIMDEKLVTALGEVFSIERSLLRAVRGSLIGQEDAIRRGLDRLLTGF